MNGLYWLGLAIAVLLFLYLAAALFKPEIFD